MESIIASSTISLSAAMGLSLIWATAGLLLGIAIGAKAERNKHKGSKD